MPPIPASVHRQSRASAALPVLQVGRLPHVRTGRCRTIAVASRRDGHCEPAGLTGNGRSCSEQSAHRMAPAAAATTRAGSPVAERSSRNQGQAGSGGSPRPTPRRPALRIPLLRVHPDRGDLQQRRLRNSRRFQAPPAPPRTARTSQGAAIRTSRRKRGERHAKQRWPPDREKAEHEIHDEVLHEGASAQGYKVPLQASRLNTAVAVLNSRPP